MANRVFLWAERVGRAASRIEQAGRPLPVSLRLKRALADRLVFRKIRAIFGGRVRYFLSSSAPISLEIIEFFHAAGMLILEAWGQTEVSCFATINFQDDYRLGSVGKALPGTELKIADDGEILVRGAIVFKGYLSQPELTAETLTEDGWIHTGDLGRLDQDGFLWITGRKKEIIITAGGKNVTPANIENLLKDHPLIDQALVHGDRRKYLTALLGLDPETLKAWASEKGIGYASYEAILDNPALLDEVQSIVDEVNRHFARYETIKRFALLPRLLDVEKGELTPTMKIRRKVIEERFKDLLDSLYDE
jgi:long-chain acyl-CoA synthetase